MSIPLFKPISTRLHGQYEAPESCPIIRNSNRSGLRSSSSEDNKRRRDFVLGTKLASPDRPRHGSIRHDGTPRVKQTARHGFLDLPKCRQKCCMSFYRIPCDSTVWFLPQFRSEPSPNRSNRVSSDPAQMDQRSALQVNRARSVPRNVSFAITGFAGRLRRIARVRPDEGSVGSRVEAGPAAFEGSGRFAGERSRKGFFRESLPDGGWWQN